MDSRALPASAPPAANAATVADDANDADADSHSDGNDSDRDAVDADAPVAVAANATERASFDPAVTRHRTDGGGVGGDADTDARTRD